LGKELSCLPTEKISSAYLRGRFPIYLRRKDTFHNITVEIGDRE
jgi:hypothetical protein